MGQKELTPSVRSKESKAGGQEARVATPIKARSLAWCLDLGIFQMHTVD